MTKEQFSAFVHLNLTTFTSWGIVKVRSQLCGKSLAKGSRVALYKKLVISHVLLVLVSDTVVSLITDNYDDYLDSSEWVTVDCTSKVLH